MDEMHRIAIDGVELEYEARGTGDAVVLVHHGAGIDWFKPLFGQHALATRYRVVRYHRAGYGRSSPLAPPMTFAREARLFRALLRRLGIERAHVVGHSASGCIVLQVALEVPDLVHSLALLEPALLAIPSPPDVPAAIEMFRNGDTSGAVDTFLRATCGPECRAIVERALPGGTEQALASAATFFGHELPALRQWSFGPDEASRVRQPVLAVVGEASDARYHRRHELLLEWLPDVEPFVLPAAGHLMLLQDPRGLAEALAGFFARRRH